MSLPALALETLRDPTPLPGLKQLACSTLLHAIEQGIEVPRGTHWALWCFVLGQDSSVSGVRRHEIPDVDVARDAVRVLRDRDSGENACEVAFSILRGENLEAVTEADLGTLADRSLDENRVRRLSWLAERVHERVGLSPSFLIQLRDRLACSPVAIVRATGVELGALLPHFDASFSTRLLTDDSPVVRTAVADALEKVEPPDRATAVLLLRQQLEREKHRTVLSSLHYAMGTLVRSGGRRVREWDPMPDDKET